MKSPLNAYPEEVLLKISDLEVRFPGPQSDIVVVDGVSLEIRSQEVFGLIGETGAGKSMTAFAAIDLLPPPGRTTRGQVWFRDRRLTGMEEKELRLIRGRNSFSSGWCVRRSS